MNKEEISLCIFSPLNNAYSETFIKNHIEYLPYRIVVVNGTDLSTLSFQGRFLINDSFIGKSIAKIGCRIFKKRDARGEKGINSFLKKNNVKIALAEYGHIGAVIFPVCKKLNIPLVVNFHGNDASHKPSLEALSNAYKNMFNYASSVIAVSKAMMIRLSDLGAEKNKLIYNCYGVDIDLFKINNRKFATPTFVAVGRFVEKKAPHLTITAFARARQKCQNIRLIMFGDGPLLDACKQLAKGYGINNDIIFKGVQSPIEIAETVAQSLAFVQHSVIAEDGGAEGTPLAILEAGACGVPVISTRHEGIKDVVIEKGTGLLVNEFDVEAMADAMVFLVENPEIASQMGEKTRVHISENFSLKKHIDRLSEIILKSYQGNI